MDRLLDGFFTWGCKSIFTRCNELAVQASNDILGVGDREAIALEFDELKGVAVHI